ncbi:collagenase-like PrtC family protease [Bradyrhizobium sp. USDA 4501]
MRRKARIAPSQAQLLATQSQIDALRYAIAQGVQTVSYGDKRVEYRSLAEMLQILNDMENEVAGLVPTRQFRIVSPADKGL